MILAVTAIGSLSSGEFGLFGKKRRNAALCGYPRYGGNGSESTTAKGTSTLELAFAY